MCNASIWKSDLLWKGIPINNPLKNLIKNFNISPNSSLLLLLVHRNGINKINMLIYYASTSNLWVSWFLLGVNVIEVLLCLINMGENGWLHFFHNNLDHNNMVQPCNIEKWSLFRLHWLEWNWIYSIGLGSEIWYVALLGFLLVKGPP